MTEVPVAAFKDRVSTYIAAAERGEEVVITRHGKPAVRLVAVGDDAERRAKVKWAIDGLARHRAAMRAKGMSVSAEEWVAWKNEGRR